MIVNAKVKELVLQLAEHENLRESKSLVENLIHEIRQNLNHDKVRKRYKEYQSEGSVLSRYPLDADGYAISYDPIEQEEEFFECWRKYGIVVSKSIVSSELCKRTINRLCEITESLSNGACKLTDPKTHEHIPVDSHGTPFLSRGFLEMYHDKFASDLRQLVKLYIHHVLIWGTTDLWTSFDRFGVKLPDHKDSKGLPLHVDQNPLQHPDFKTIQGVLALVDCPEERGSFVGVPGSKSLFLEYKRMAGAGEYVELQTEDPIAKTLMDHAQVFPLRAGDLVSWDSRTTHCNSSNVSDQMRIVAYIAAGPVPADEQEAVEPREAAFQSGLGSNVRESLMHASMPPRYTNQEHVARVREQEQLSYLGKLLYGQESYSSIT